MSWGSRWPSWGAPFSPFGRTSSPATSGPAQVREEDFEYIRPEDLTPIEGHADGDGHHHHSHSVDSGSGHHHSHSVDDEHHHHHHNSTSGSVGGVHHHRSPSPERDTDVLVIKTTQSAVPVHFPTHSISSGELRVADLRSHAAKKLHVSHPSRVRLYHRGRHLKDDHRACRDEGLRHQSEITCLTGDEESLSRTSTRDSRYAEDDDDDDDDDDRDGSGVNDDGLSRTSTNASGAGGGRKKRSGRRRKGGSSRRTEIVDPPSTAYHHDPSRVERAEFLGVPSHHPPPQPAPRDNTSGAGGATSSDRSRSHSRAPSPSTQGNQSPQTPIGKLNALHAKLMELLPAAEAFLKSPPPEKEKRAFEHKRLTETILTQVLLKLDAVESEGDEEARQRRKALVKETQGWLNRLDENK